ncbi:hypothetical protein D3C78_1520640 [compost metagenome]
MREWRRGGVNNGDFFKGRRGRDAQRRIVAFLNPGGFTSHAFLLRVDKQQCGFQPCERNRLLTAVQRQCLPFLNCFQKLSHRYGIVGHESQGRNLPALRIQR